MAKPIDYSKWKDIEISDDEDDTHPNIDTPSLFRWRHQARMDRMAEAEKEKAECDKGKKDAESKLEQAVKKLEAAKDSTNPEALKEATDDIMKLKEDEEKWLAKEEELAKKEKLAPWNVDTIGKEGFSKSIISKPKPARKEDMSDEELSQRQRDHEDKYEKLMKKFGMMKKYDDSKQFLMDQKDLVCDETANYLVLWCIRLEVEGKSELMNHVSHQTIVMQFILELAKSLNYDPRDCISSFFTRIKTAEKQYLEAFNDELSSFRNRVKERAKVRIEEALKEQEEEERKARLGPGGLDPVDVFESLPVELQECFEARDIPMLQKVLTTFPEVEAREYLQKCIDSGLWVPDASKVEPATEPAAANSDDTQGESTAPAAADAADAAAAVSSNAEPTDGN